MKLIHRLVIPGLILLIGTSLPVFARQPALEEIKVTGQGVGGLRLNAVNHSGSRLGLAALDTPASVDLITAEEILLKGDYRAHDTITRSTGISSTASPGDGGTGVSSRGFTGHNSTVYTYDGIRLYVVAGTVTFPSDSWLAERIEVLRGAGSIINGIGAVGTTINYVPKSPGFAGSSLEGQASVGSFGMRRIALGGGAQLSENLAFRLDGAYTEEDGHVDRNDTDRTAVAGSLLFRPFDDLSIRISVDYTENDSPTYFGTPLINGMASDAHRKQNFNFSDAKAVHEDLWPRIHTEWQMTPDITFRHDLYFIDVRREWQNVEEYSFDANTNQVDRAFFLGIIHDQQQFGTRGDFLIETNPGSMKNRLVIGAEVNDVNLDYSDNFFTGGFDFADSVPVSGFDPGVVPANIPTVLDYSTDSTQWAVFIDDVLEVTDELSLVIGGRFDNYDFHRFNHEIISAARPSSAFNVSYTEFTWRAGLVYQPFDAFSLYGQYSTAADPVTSPVSISAANRNFDLSSARQYEFGIKQQLPGMRAEYTLAWFDIEKEDLLTRRPGSLITEQVGQQSSRGVEFTFRWSPLDNINMDLNAAWIDAEFDEFFSGGVSLAGNTPENVPETTANLWVNWTPIPRLQVGGGVRYVDGRFADNANTQRLPSYLVVDAVVNWQLLENLTLSLRGRNLNDEDDYVLSQYTTNQWIFGDPRSWELGLAFSF